MLVLSRERGETVNIGDEIEVTVIDIRGDKVRLGVSAPRHVTVHRKEVYDAIKRQKESGGGEAGSGPPPESPSRPRRAARTAVAPPSRRRRAARAPPSPALRQSPHATTNGRASATRRRSTRAAVVKRPRPRATGGAPRASRFVLDLSRRPPHTHPWPRR